MKNMQVFLDQRKQAKRQWVQDSSQSTVNNLNNVRCGASRHFRNKKKEHLKDKMRILKLTVRSKILETSMGVSMTSRRITSVELI